MVELKKLHEDPCMYPFMPVVEQRKENALATERKLAPESSLADFASAHEYYGLHRTSEGWVFREWAPNATAICLIGDFSEWREQDHFWLNRIPESDVWELHLPTDSIRHGDLYRLNIHWPHGMGERIPAYARRVVQDHFTKIFTAQVWNPDRHYCWKHPRVKVESPLIYEAHVGMSQEKQGVGTYDEFRLNTLPYVMEAGYNTIQLMAVMEHPYYGSFGYHVANFFAASSRFGTPEELKQLIDATHEAGIAVIIDLVHSHSVNNEKEGLSCFDGTEYQYFHSGARGLHEAWDSRCFDYGKTEVLHFLLSNCRYWLDEFNLDGFRFDGVTSMLYFDHGLGTDFGNYDDYFGEGVDEDALTYLTLANKLIHQINPDAITVAEDVSGMPGLGVKVEAGGIGFDYKLAMGMPDFWFKQLEQPDESWNMDVLWYELVNRRKDEKSINYVECHDQAIVGGKTLIFELMDSEMYFSMDNSSQNIVVDRGMALHKMIRLATMAAAGQGYLNFMGNEFGHPEWIDFPREGNNWSYKYAQRHWSLCFDEKLRYRYLAAFDKAVVKLLHKESLLASHNPELAYVHCDDKVLAFKRGDLLFIFNFHPSASYSEYFVDAEGGTHKLLIDSDAAEFGGFSRNAPDQTYCSGLNNNTGRNGIKVYLPSRSALVLQC